MLEFFAGKTRENAWPHLPPSVRSATSFQSSANSLNHRDRSVLTVAGLTALYRPDQLKGPLWRALDNGVTREEIVELITHLAFYAGWANAGSAALIAKQVFQERKN